MLYSSYGEVVVVESKVVRGVDGGIPTFAVKAQMPWSWETYEEFEKRITAESAATDAIAKHDLAHRLPLPIDCVIIKTKEGAKCPSIALVCITTLVILCVYIH